MNWRFVGYAIAGYLTVAGVVVYGAAAATLVQVVDWQDVVAIALWMSPLGAMAGAGIETTTR